MNVRTACPSPVYLGYGHDSTIVQDSNNKNHKRRKVEFPDQSHQHEAQDDTDRDRYSIYGVIFHPLKNASGCKYSRYDHTQTCKNIQLTYILSMSSTSTRRLHADSNKMHESLQLATGSPGKINSKKLQNLLCCLR